MNTEEALLIIDWPSQLTAWRDSGLPMTRYCRQQGLVTHQMSCHKQDILKKSAIVKPSGFARADIAEKYSAEGLAISLAHRLP